MKKIAGIPALLCLVFFCTMQMGVTSCTKDHTIYDTVNHTIYDTVTQTKQDTLVIKDTAISLQLITANSWKMQELIGVQGNTMLNYQRGAAGNTVNYDADNITFNSNGTGTYVDGAGASHAITWNFTNSTNTQITWVISDPGTPSETIVYDNIRYKNKQLLFDQYWTYNGLNAHAQAIRIAP